MNRIKFTCRQAGLCHTLPAIIRHLYFMDAAAVTCCFNHAYNLTLVVILHRYRRLTKRHSRPLAYDFFFLINTAAEFCMFPRNQQIRYLITDVIIQFSIKRTLADLSQYVEFKLSGFVIK